MGETSSTVVKTVVIFGIFLVSNIFGGNFHSLFGEDVFSLLFDSYFFFSMGWFNHQPDATFRVT